MDVEWLIIADAAQVVGGKLYLMGGGYDRVTLPKEPPATHNMAVAVAFRVSWHETNVKHDFELEVLEGLSAALPCLSFEYTPERLEPAFACIARLNEIGDYELSYSVEEDFELELEPWVSAGELERHLLELRETGRSGDIYARLRRQP